MPKVINIPPPQKNEVYSKVCTTCKGTKEDPNNPGRECKVCQEKIYQVNYPVFEGIIRSEFLAGALISFDRVKQVFVVQHGRIKFTGASLVGVVIESYKWRLANGVGCLKQEVD